MGRRARVLVITRAGSDSLRPGVLERLSAVSDLRVVVRQHAPGPAEAADLMRDVTVLACTNVCLPELDAALLQRCPSLRHVVLYAAGYEHVDLDLLTRHGVTLSVLPEYATPAVAEHALAMTFALAARVHLANDRSRGLVAAGTSLRGLELGGRTLGVVGTGRIGTHLLGLGRGIGMRVLGADTDPVVSGQRRREGVEMVPLSRLLRCADVVAVCASTVRGAGPVLDARRVRQLRSGALLVNVGRPALVSTPTVLAALRTGRLRGYGVDEVVLPAGSPDLDLVDEGRLLQTGHSAWWRDEVLERGARMFSDAVLAAALGRPVDVVGPAVPAQVVELRELASAGAS